MAEPNPLGVSKRVFLWPDCRKLELLGLLGVQGVALVLSVKSIRLKFRVDLELITLEEYLGVSPAFCGNAARARQHPCRHLDNYVGFQTS